LTVPVMVQTSRKSRPLDRSLEHRRDTRLVIIAAEGRETEQQYFALSLAPGSRSRSWPRGRITAQPLNMSLTACDNSGTTMTWMKTIPSG